jgi:hypothetical protein
MDWGNLILDDTVCSQEHKIKFIQISLKQRILKKGKKEKREKCETGKQRER